MTKSADLALPKVAVAIQTLKRLLWLRWTHMPCHTGAFSAGDTLVPIPNTKVKTCCGDDTLYGESSTVPDYSKTTRKRGFWRLNKAY